MTTRFDGRPVVVGSGIAGLTLALSLGDCLVVTKTEVGAGASRWARGGVAAAIGDDDSPALHAADTLAVAGEIAQRRIVELVTGAAPERISWLERLGARFDRDAEGRLLLGREAGHSRHRIVHAAGDATGAELMRVLVAAVRVRPDIEVLEDTLAVDLIRSGDRVAGVLVEGPDGERRALFAPAVVLATGGIGQVYARTTNPPESTGDGLAMAIRAGALVADLEFVQFHPTALAVDADPLPLLTEALRGAGARLVTGNGERFMVGEHPDAELAPRDVVARAIGRRLIAGEEVFLDVSTIDGLDRRFPTVVEAAVDAGIDLAGGLLPVTPAAHYHMGGIAVDRYGRASLPGLYALGECASSGLHGANRLASNSLLEGLVYGAEVAEAIRREATDVPDGPYVVPADGVSKDGGIGRDDGADEIAIGALRRIMWDQVGLFREDVGLAVAERVLGEVATEMSTVEGRNLATVARAVAHAARRRRESRGAHHRLDHPRPDLAWRRRVFRRPDPVETRPLEPAHVTSAQDTDALASADRGAA